MHSNISFKKAFRLGAIYSSSRAFKFINEITDNYRRMGFCQYFKYLKMKLFFLTFSSCWFSATIFAELFSDQILDDTRMTKIILERSMVKVYKLRVLVGTLKYLPKEANRDSFKNIKATALQPIQICQEKSKIIK